MRKTSKSIPAQCQLFPPQPTNLLIPVTISPRLIHLLVKLLRGAADRYETRQRILDGSYE